MTIFKHELRKNGISLAVWASVIACMLGVCVLVYPEMKGEMDGLSELFANMGGFSAAFGLDKLQFGEFMGFFGVECGNVLGLGGAFFAALTGIGALASEESEHTAEFLLTHPVSRSKVVLEKWAAVLTQVLILNAAVALVTWAAVAIIGESPDICALLLLWTAYFIMQVEIAAICFGISAYISRGGLGVGLGLAAAFYFLNIIANLTDKARFLKYFTPFGYTDSGNIINEGCLDWKYLAAGLFLTAIALAAAFWHYRKKDVT